MQQCRIFGRKFCTELEKGKSSASSQKLRNILTSVNLRARNEEILKKTASRTPQQRQKAEQDAKDSGEMPPRASSPKQVENWQTSTQSKTVQSRTKDTGPNLMDTQKIPIFPKASISPQKPELPKAHPYVTKMLGETHAEEYVNSVKNFIDEHSLKEMFDTLEKSSFDHFDPDDPDDTRRRRVEDRSGRSDHVTEWDDSRWSEWFRSHDLAEFLDPSGRPIFSGPLSISDIFQSLNKDEFDKLVKSLKKLKEEGGITLEKMQLAESYLVDMFNSKVGHRTALDDYRIRLKKYFGSGRMIERRTFDHFHKSFPLSPVPPHLYQEEDVNKRPKESEDYYNPGLYLPHPMKWLPDWGHRKHIASVYGPHYLNYASMPLPNMPTPEEIHEKRLERQRERAYRKRGELLKKRLQRRAEKLAKEKFDLTLYGKEVKVSKLSAIAATSAADEFSGSKVTYVGPRRAQVFDPHTFRDMKGPGDPALPQEFKDMIFENYLSTIDKNNSLPAWKKIYAMHLIPRAFGGPEGDFLDEIDEEPELLTRVDDTLFEGSGEVVSADDDGVGDLGL